MTGVQTCALPISGVKIDVSKNGVDLESVKEAAAVLLRKSVKNVIITLGSNGVAYINNERFIYTPCIDIVEVVDPTAAGDSFTGAFCTAMCMGMTEEDALEFASYTATLTVSRMGAQPSLPSYEEVVRLMESNKK